MSTEHTRTPRYFCSTVFKNSQLHYHYIYILYIYIVIVFGTFSSADSPVPDSPAAAPPPRRSKQGRRYPLYKARYKYTAKQDDEMSISKGEVSVKAKLWSSLRIDFCFGSGEVRTGGDGYAKICLVFHACTY